VRRADKLTTFNRNLLELYGPVQSRNGIALPFFFHVSNTRIKVLARRSGRSLDAQGEHFFKDLHVTDAKV